MANPLILAHAIAKGAGNTVSSGKPMITPNPAPEQPPAHTFITNVANPNPPTYGFGDFLHDLGSGSTWATAGMLGPTILQKLFGGGSNTPTKAPKTAKWYDAPVPKGKQGTAATATTPGGVPPDIWKQLFGGLSTPPPLPPAPQYQQPSLVGVPQVGADQSKYETDLLNKSLSLSNPDYGKLIAGALPLAGQFVDPQIKALLEQGLIGQNTIQGYTQSAQNALGGIANQIGQGYDHAAALQGQISKGVQDSLAAMNPQQTEQALLGPNMNPQITSQLQTSYPLAGRVLGGEGALNAGSLEAQKAAATGLAKLIPSILGISGQQALASEQIGNQTALAKLYGQQGADAIKLAGMMASGDQRAAGLLAGLYKGERSNDIATQRLGLDAATTNASNIIKTNYDNAQLQFKAYAAATSRYQAETSRRRAFVYLYKALNPTASSSSARIAGTQALNDAKSAAGITPAGYTTQKNPTTGAVTRIPDTTNKRVSYFDWINQYATAHPENQQAAQFALSVANTVWRPGYGGRPLDPDMTQALEKAHVYPDVYTTPSGSFFSEAQRNALGASGHKTYALSLTPKIATADVPEIGVHKGDTIYQVEPLK